MRVPHEIDALFTLPLAEFTAARNALAASLRKAGRKLEAERVKGLAKPPATAWAVNQLYWLHRKDFDRLFALGEKVREASANASALRPALATRRALISELADRAAAILRDAGHGATPDAMRRITITLETLSSSASANGDAGRLTRDLEPLGFDDLSALLGGTATAPANVLPFDRTSQKAKAAQEQRAAEKEAAARRAAEAAARERTAQAVKAAEETLKEARQVAARAEAALTKARAQVDAVEKQKRELEARLAQAQEIARAASREADAEPHHDS